MPIQARIIIEIFSLAMASLWGFLGISMLCRSYKRKASGIATVGVVVGHQERRYGELVDTTYSPDVEFETRNGEKIVFTASSGSTRRTRVGHKVRVFYYPDNPRDADIAAPLTSWIVPLLLLAFGLGFLFMAIAVLFVKSK
jgi:hypothetical protein